MSIYKGTTLLAGGPVTIPLFTHMRQDHIVNDISWLRSDTFSWQSGAVYVSAYNHLVNDLMTNVETLYCWNRPTKEVYTTKENPSIGDSVYIINNGIVEFASTIDNISGNVIYPSGMQAYTRYSYGDINNQEVPITAETETISGTTITFYRATDGHKIVLADQESNVISIYASTGTAWYYILDTTNTRFKLPRETGMHLYFYIGQFTQTAIQQTAGITAEALNGKADIANITDLCMPNYAQCIAGGLISPGTWIQVPKDSQVVCWGTDPYTENYNTYVSPDSGQTLYQVGYRYDDTNGNTEGTSFCFLVPKNWYFTCNVEQGFHYRIYPLKGAN